MISREELNSVDPATSAEFTDEQLAAINAVILRSCATRQDDALNAYEKRDAAIKILYKFLQIKKAFAEVFAENEIGASWDILIPLIVPKISRQKGGKTVGISTLAFVETDGALTSGKEGWANQQYTSLRGILVKRKDITNIEELPVEAPKLPQQNPGKTTGLWKSYLGTPSETVSVEMAPTSPGQDTAAGPSNSVSGNIPEARPSKKSKRTHSSTTTKARTGSKRKSMVEEQYPSPQPRTTLEIDVKHTECMKRRPIEVQMERAMSLLKKDAQSLELEIAKKESEKHTLSPHTVHRNVEFWKNDQMTELMSKLTTMCTDNTRSQLSDALTSFVQVYRPDFKKEHALRDNPDMSLGQADLQLLKFVVECIRECQRSV